MKKFLFLSLALILLLTSVASAEKNPVRIARLPIIFKSTVPDQNTCAELETKLERATHIPMNKTLQVAEYLPAEDTTKALDEIWQDMHSKNKKAHLKDAMRPLAEKINADIIVCPILLSYRQYVDGFSGFDETYIYSYAQAELIVYDRRTDDLIDKKTSQMYRDAISIIGTADYLAKICFDKLIDATKLHQLIMAIGK